MADANISAIGKYQIIELLGEGAMGVVYKAQDSVLKRTVAIKVMSDSIARQDDLRTRFLREAQAAGSLQHPNIVCIHDFGESDGHLFIAMEYIHGVDLEQLIDLREPLSLQVKLDVIIDVLIGLAFAHKHGVIHRDIKPANIRVCEDGRAKIMDFGVAHLTSSSMTRTGSILGTPSYMAPEQIMEGKTSPASDIFAVGAVLYQLMASMKPFDAPNLQNLLFKIVCENPRPVSELIRELPPALDHILQKSMAKDPSARYANALDMANDLTSVRAGLSGTSLPASVSSRASVASAMEQPNRIARWRTRSFALAGGGALTAASLIAIAWSQLPRSGPEDRETPDKPRPAATSAPGESVFAKNPSTLTVSSAPLAANVLAASRHESSGVRVSRQETARVDTPSVVAKTDLPARAPGSPVSAQAGGPPSEITTDPRKELASIGVAWSTQSFIDALQASDARSVRLFLDGGMSATTLHRGTSAVVWILQPLLPDPIPMLKLLIERGYDVNAILVDATIMRHYGDRSPLPPYWDPQDLPQYSSFHKVFSGPALLWVVMHATYMGATKSDLDVIDFLRRQGADTKLTLRYLAFMESGLGDTDPYKQILPMLRQ